MRIKYLITALTIFSVKAFSQTPISLEGAYDRAFQNNLDLKGGQLKIDYQNAVQKSYAVIDPLNINVEAGQMNSAYVDNKIAASQVLRMPRFYSSQKTLLHEEMISAAMTLDLQKWLLKKEIALVYNNLNYLDEKEKLLRKADGIYSTYFQRSELRLKKGESNILEKTTAENYRSQAEIQLNSLIKDREIALYQFNMLLGGDHAYRNADSDFYTLETIENPVEYSGNPLQLKLMEQQKSIENARLEAEKSKLLPSFNVAVNSMTMKGTGADDKYYNGTHRFQSGLVGIALPLFNSAQKSVIEGQKINQQIAENNYQLALRNSRNQYAKIYGEYQKLKSETDYYRTSGLQNAEKILFTANLLMKEGEINYLEYTMLVNQSLEIENKYIDARKMLNEKIIELNHLTSEN